MVLNSGTELMFNLDQDIQFDIILMDFAKAFDKVFHKHLLYKQVSEGASTIECSHPESYNQWYSTSSSQVSVTSSMLQGTILGPLLFLVHINDLSDHIKHSTVRLFTDNCILHRHIQCDHVMLLLQEDNISLYVCGPLHGKCSLTQISIVHEHHNCIKHPMSATYTIPVVNEFKYLGIVIQSDLKWDLHIIQITAKVNQKLAMSKRNIKLVPKI